MKKTLLAISIALSGCAYLEDPYNRYEFNRGPFGQDECIFNVEGKATNEPCVDLRQSAPPITEQMTLEYWISKGIPEDVKYQYYRQVSELEMVCYVYKEDYCPAFYDKTNKVIHAVYGDVWRIKHEQAHAAGYKHLGE